jgi:hypothetical protein
MNAKLFVKDEQSLWENGEIFSAGVYAEEVTLDLESGFENEEKFLYWVKTRNKERAIASANEVVKQLNKGTLCVARVFSDEPFYLDQESDINPTTNVVLNRYSKTILCTPDKRASLHRSFVVAPPSVALVAEPQVQAEA